MDLSYLDPQKKMSFSYGGQVSIIYVHICFSALVQLAIASTQLGVLGEQLQSHANCKSICTFQVVHGEADDRQLR